MTLKLFQRNKSLGSPITNFTLTTKIKVLIQRLKFLKLPQKEWRRDIISN